MRVGSGRDTTGLGWVLTDHLGSVRKILNAANLLDVASRVYYTSGVTQSETIGTLDTTLRFTGQRLIVDLGMYFYQSRWYDPVSSRWLQADTMVPNAYNPTDWDRYAYVGFNPIRYKDPTGHASKDDNTGGCDISCTSTTNSPTTPNTYSEPPNTLDENLWDLVPVVSDIRGIIRGSQTANWAFNQPGFMQEEKTYQTWVNNCYSVCHGASPEPGSPSGGPMPDVPLVDTYSQGAGEAGGNAVSLLIDATYAKATTNIFAYGGTKWHVGWQTNDEWSIIHLGNEPKLGGIHLAIGSVGPRKAFFHIYFWPPETAHFYVPRIFKK